MESPACYVTVREGKPLVLAVACANVYNGCIDISLWLAEMFSFLWAAETMQESLVFLILGVGGLREDQLIYGETRENMFFIIWDL